MIALLALAVAATQPVADAERAFAAMAQKHGQWTAFRAFSTPDAKMLIDGPQPAQPFLATLKDPPTSVMWWPARTYTSCDGSLAFSTGPWRIGGKSQGEFFTIWQKQPDGNWKWVYDGGVELKAPISAGERVKAVHASCRLPKAAAAMIESDTGGASRDGTLRWALSPISGTKEYRFRVLFVRNGGWEVAQDSRVH
jgi:ketosteroid isomerase-like protein